MPQDSDLLTYFVAGTIFGIALQWLLFRCGDYLMGGSVRPHITIINHIESPEFGAVVDDDDDSDDWWKKGKPSSN